MDSKNLKDYYDVVIVGIGFAGIECAKNLGNSNLSVLLIEKDKEKDIGRKVCAGGVTLSDLNYLSKDLLNFDFQKALICYKKKSIIISGDNGIISTINKREVFRGELSHLKDYDNVTVLTGVFVRSINSDNCLEFDSGEKVKFGFLVGADGATSVVRKYLNLSTNKLEIAIQYVIPKRFENFELHFDGEFFGTGYLWIFPHKDYTLIGSISDARFINSGKLKDNLDCWLKKRNIDFSKKQFEAASITYDYKGYCFGNIFLAGDAAGLSSGLLGKGIYPARLSGQQIAREILCQDSAPNLILGWLEKKKQQERLMFFLKNPISRKIFLPILMRLLHYKKIQRKLVNFIR